MKKQKVYCMNCGSMQEEKNIKYLGSEVWVCPNCRNRKVKNKYKSKWGLIGVTPKQLKKIYDKKRLIAYTILKNKYPIQYSFILRELMHEEYKKIIVKGGLK